MEMEQLGVGKNTIGTQRLILIFMVLNLGIGMMGEEYLYS